MNSIVWQLQPTTAQLHCGQLRASIDLSKPSQGWTNLAVASREVPGAMLLAVALAWDSHASEVSPADSHIRGADLVASYRPASLPTQVDVLWRAVAAGGEDAAIAIVDVIVSVRSEQLESQSELMVQSVLPCEELWRPLAPSGRFTALDAGVGPVMLQPEDGASCWLFRLPGGELSYAEMVHPADFCEDRLERVPPTASRQVKLAHRLFPEPLEKGVLLRARVRGALVPRANDVQWTAASFASFAAAEPLLGT